MKGRPAHKDGPNTLSYPVRVILKLCESVTGTKKSKLIKYIVYLKVITLSRTWCLTFEYDVFISYSHKDESIVHPLAECLTKDGLRVWLDELVIQVGESIPLKIQQGLKKSHKILICMSPAYFQSEWANTEHLTQLFDDPTNKKRRLIPLLITDCSLPDFIAHLKHIDYRKPSKSVYKKILESCQEMNSDPTPTIPITNLQSNNSREHIENENFIASKKTVTREEFLKFKCENDESEQYLEVLNEIVDIFEKEYSNSKDIDPYEKRDSSHCKKVEENIYRLIPLEEPFTLTCRERFLLISSVWLHDIGMIPNLFYDRDNNERYLKGIKKSSCVSEIVSNISKYINKTDNEPIYDEGLFLKLFPDQVFQNYTTDKKEPKNIQPSDINNIRQKHSQRSCIYILNSSEIQSLINSYRTKDKIKDNFKDDFIKIAVICLLHPRNAYPILNRLNNDNIFVNQNGSNSSSSFIRLPLLIAYLRLADILHIPDKEDKNDFAKFLARGPDQKAKFHWCKSRFIKDIDIHPENNLIKIVTKIPENIDFLELPKWKEKIVPLQTYIKEEIQWELDSVRDILCRGGISYCLRIDYKESETDQNLTDDDIREYEQVLKYIDLVNNTSETPSSSLIVGSIVKILKVILDSKYNDEKILHLEDFKKNVLEKEMSHRSKQALIDDIRTKMDPILRYKNDEKRVTNLLTKFTKFINEWDNNRVMVVQQIARKALPLFEQDDLILLYGYSDTILQCIAHFLTKVERKKLELYVCEVRPKTAYSYNNRLLYSDGIKNIKTLENLDLESNANPENRRIHIYYLPDIAVSHLFEIKIKEGKKFKVILGTNAINYEGSITHTLGVKMIADAAYAQKVPVFVIAESAKCINIKLNKPLEDNFRERWLTTDIAYESILDNSDNFNPREDIITIDKIAYYVTENIIANSKDYYEFINDTVKVDSKKLVSALKTNTDLTKIST